MHVNLALCVDSVSFENNAGGRRFRYTPQPTKADGAINEIYEFIEYLDRKGMYLIEMQCPGDFSDYLREYSNTICGRHPIDISLAALCSGVCLGTRGSVRQVCTIREGPIDQRS